MSEILVLHGPNLNLLGDREPEVYGTETLADINARWIPLAEASGRAATCIQSNAENDLVDAVQAAKTAGTQFIIINPAAFTHTSVALRDALRLPSFEVAGEVLLNRLTLICRDGVIEDVIYPVFPPDENASQVVERLKKP